MVEHERRGMGAEDYCTCDGPWPCPGRYREKLPGDMTGIKAVYWVPPVPGKQAACVLVETPGVKDFLRFWPESEDVDWGWSLPDSAQLLWSSEWDRYAGVVTAHDPKHPDAPLAHYGVGKDGKVRQIHPVLDKFNRNADTFEQDVQKVFDEARGLLIRKHHDYGPTNISRSPGGPLNGLRVRMWDKQARLNNLLDSGAEPENESLRDSFKDLLNYCAIALMVLDERWPER